ncbi:hypothetical protein RQP46_000441 [Phenoliferia psychrophenolica]
MGLSIGHMAYVCLLLINSIATNPAAPYSYGTGFDSYGHPDAVAEGPGIKQRLVLLVGAVRTLMRSEWKFMFLVPLIPINIVVIIYELLLG